MKKRTVFLFSIITCTSLILTGCTSRSERSKSIATSLYPLEFVAQQIAGDNFHVINITPVGVEPHDFELSASATQDVLDAQLAIVLGGSFQPAIEKTAASRDSHTLDILDAIESNQHDSEGDDPHVWLDPVEMKYVVDVVTDAIVEIDPHHKEQYVAHALEFTKKLDALHTSYRKALGSCELSTFVTSHDAFSRLADRYDLTHESIAGFSPEAEPTPARMKQIADVVERENITTIFSEELASPKVAGAIRRETGVEIKVLSPIEGLTQDHIDSNEDYFTLMEKNRDRLSSALRCSAS